MKSFKRTIPALGIVFDENGKVLLTKRYYPERDDEFHGMWALPGGNIDFGEQAHEAALREVHEETGIVAELVSKQPIIMIHNDLELKLQIIGIAYAMKYLNGAIDVSKDDLTSDAQWFEVDKINFYQTLPLTKKLINEAKKYL